MLSLWTCTGKDSPPTCSSMWILISHPENTFGTCSLPLGLGGFALGCGYSGKGALSSSESTGRVIGESGLFPPAHGDTLGKSSPSASENAARFHTPGDL